MIEQSIHQKKFAACYNLQKLLINPEDEQVEVDNKTGRAMRKIKRVNVNGPHSDVSSYEDIDEPESGTYDMKFVTVRGPPEMDSSHTHTEQSQVSISLNSIKDTGKKPYHEGVTNMQQNFQSLNGIPSLSVGDENFQDPISILKDQKTVQLTEKINQVPSSQMINTFDQPQNLQVSINHHYEQLPTRQSISQRIVISAQKHVV